MNNDRKELIEKLKQHRKQRAEAKREEFEKEEAKRQARKKEKLETKKVNKIKIKEIKKEIKTLRNQKHQQIKQYRESINDKKELKIKIEECTDQINEQIVNLKNSIIDIKFDYGKKFQTLNWKLLKWVYGIRKEFNRIIWSSPINTFKYLAIIVVLVLILSGIFLAIDSIVNTFIN